MTEPSGSRKVYDGDLFDVLVENWNGREREIVEHPGATAIVAIDREAYVTLVRQTREAVRKQLVELPAGTLEAGEEPLASAQRELAEEVGLHGGRWRELAAFYTTPGFCNERMHLFLAEAWSVGMQRPRRTRAWRSFAGKSRRSRSVSRRSKTPRRSRACSCTCARDPDPSGRVRLCTPPPWVGFTPASLVRSTIPTNLAPVCDGSVQELDRLRTG
ncbi:MAG: NUDIX hydrolase [Gaiellaceae bacterium]